jgi:hypothetical protein
MFAVNKFGIAIAIQTLGRVGRGKEGSEWVRRFVFGKYLEEAQADNDLAGLFSGGKTDNPDRMASDGRTYSFR